MCRTLTKQFIQEVRNPGTSDNAGKSDRTCTKADAFHRWTDYSTADDRSHRSVYQCALLVFWPLIFRVQVRSNNEFRLRTRWLPSSLTSRPRDSMLYYIPSSCSLGFRSVLNVACHSARTNVERERPSWITTSRHRTALEVWTLYTVLSYVWHQGEAEGRQNEERHFCACNHG